MHILPGIDDGAADSDEALGMLEVAYRDGIRHIVATPHFTPSGDRDTGGAATDISARRNSTDMIRERVNELREVASENNLDINVYPGSEVLLHPEIPSIYDTGSICTINETRYVLVEFPLQDIPGYAGNVLYQLQLKGLVPIIAHPERCLKVVDNPGILRDLIERGMLAQVSACSLTGGYGRRIKKITLKLIGEGLVQFVASDAHNIRHRAPELSKAAGIVEKKFGREVVEKLFYVNCMTVLENGSVRAYTGRPQYSGLPACIIKIFNKSIQLIKSMGCK